MTSENATISLQQILPKQVNKKDSIKSSNESYHLEAAIDGKAQKWVIFTLIDIIAILCVY